MMGLNACKMEFFYQKQPRTSLFHDFKKVTGNQPQFLPTMKVNFKGNIGFQGFYAC